MPNDQVASTKSKKEEEEAIKQTKRSLKRMGNQQRGK